MLDLVVLPQHLRGCGDLFSILDQVKRAAEMSVKSVILCVTVLSLALSAPARSTKSSLTSSIPNFRHRVDGFEVVWDASTAVLSLHVAEGDAALALWATIPATAFLSMHRSKPDVRMEAAGNFRDQKQWQKSGNPKTTAQTLDSVTPFGNTSLLLSGTLKPAPHILPPIHSTPKYAYNVTFFTVPMESGTLRFNVSVQPLGASTASSSLDSEFLELTYACDADEQFLGFGEQYTFINHKGRRIPIVNAEQGIGRGLEPLTDILNTFAAGVGGDRYTTYLPIPHYISSRSRSLFLDSTAFAVFDLTAATAVQVQVDTTVGRQVAFGVVAGRTPLEVIEKYTGAVSGRMKPLPRWATGGLIVGLEGGRAVVEANLEKLLNASVPISAVWIQDWSGITTNGFGTRVYWNWAADEAQYPGWADMVQSLAKRGIQTLIYTNPFFCPTLTPTCNASCNQFTELKDRDLLVRDSKGDILMEHSGTADMQFGMLDVSNPEAAEWMVDMVSTSVLGAGVKGFMADFGEYLPYDSKIKTGNPQLLHNRYPHLMAEIYQRAAVKAGTAEPLWFVRSGSQRTPGVAPLFWMGDQLVSWDTLDGMASALTAQLSAGLSGMALSHSDAGGFTMIHDGLDKLKLGYTRTPELLARWVEMCAMSDPILRTHPGNQPTKNAQVYDDDRSMAHVARGARIHLALQDYRETLMEEAYNTGAPLVRHLFLHYQEDLMVYQLQGQFMLGRDFMMAPVLKKGKASVELYFPFGDTWIHVWSDRVVVGNGTTVLVQAPIGQPAIFYRQNCSQSALQAAKNLQSLIEGSDLSLANEEVRD
ncbi:hypothetical protein CYMTET_7580 [Cymbomonas tetramitiformis]|uniref:Alpha-glucosidase n=1 Tax=Cymbomonas tetramitiformis TaxID=36881 RepID=A0AAE0GV90_9CHLO|nr:hypothetical protein CYMTET_7580 [Cymbomonas tetramitiformis]